MEQDNFLYSDNKINANVPDFNPQGGDLISSVLLFSSSRTKKKSWLFKLLISFSFHLLLFLF
jgi:hypothetical protein